MKVLVAGATGAIGRPLVDALRARGHDVVGTSRRPGASDAVLDAFDAATVHGVIADHRPDVVVHQLTALPADANPRAMKQGLELTNRLRAETVPTFVAAAQKAGVRRLVTQSISFVTGPAGPPILDEDAPLWLDAPKDMRPAIEAVAQMEQAAREAQGLEALVLRYGFFYGPGTWYASDGALTQMIRRRAFPLIGDGEGRYSFVHVDDAVAATVAATERGTSGVYNVCDDEPVRTAEWLPELARILGAKDPRRVPAWLARRVAGGALVHYATGLRGASNAKAREAFGWQPRSWREAFRDEVGNSAAHP